MTIPTAPTRHTNPLEKWKKQRRGETSISIIPQSLQEVQPEFRFTSQRQFTHFTLYAHRFSAMSGIFLVFLFCEDEDGRLLALYFGQSDSVLHGANQFLQQQRRRWNACCLLSFSFSRRLQRRFGLGIWPVVKSKDTLAAFVLALQNGRSFSISVCLRIFENVSLSSFDSQVGEYFAYVHWLSR